MGRETQEARNARMVDERLRSERASAAAVDKQSLRDARARILDRIKARAFNPADGVVAHVLTPSLSASDLNKLVVSVEKLNKVLGSWVE